MDESSLFALNSNLRHSDHTFSDLKIVQMGKARDAEEAALVEYL